MSVTFVCQTEIIPRLAEVIVILLLLKPSCCQLLCCCRCWFPSHCYAHSRQRLAYVVTLFVIPKSKAFCISPGCNGFSTSRLSHIAELDLTDNLLSDWGEIHLLLQCFPGLEFLNLSNNVLNGPMPRLPDTMNELRMRKLVLNGNKISWDSANGLAGSMPNLEELHLSTNNLCDPVPGAFCHGALRQLFLGCNPITSFVSLTENLSVPNLELLSLAECPVNSVVDLSSVDIDQVMSRLHNLSLSTTKISTWEEVDKLRKFPSLSELRLQHCPVLNELSAHERRMMIVARLPNIQILNGGEKEISILVYL